MKVGTLIAGGVGCALAFFILALALTGLPHIIGSWYVAILMLIVPLIAAAVITAFDTSARLGVVIGLLLPPSLLLMYMVLGVVSEGRGAEWLAGIAIRLALAIMGGSLAGAWGSYFLERGKE